MPAIRTARSGHQLQQGVIFPDIPRVQSSQTRPRATRQQPPRAAADFDKAGPSPYAFPPVPSSCPVEEVTMDDSPINCGTAEAAVRPSLSCPSSPPPHGENSDGGVAMRMARAQSITCPPSDLGLLEQENLDYLMGGGPRSNPPDQSQQAALLARIATAAQAAQQTLEAKAAARVRAIHKITNAITSAMKELDDLDQDFTVELTQTAIALFNKHLPRGARKPEQRSYADAARPTPSPATMPAPRGPPRQLPETPPHPINRTQPLTPAIPRSPRTLGSSYASSQVPPPHQQASGP